MPKSYGDVDLTITVFLVISALGVFEIKMKHRYFKPVIDTPTHSCKNSVL